MPVHFLTGFPGFLGSALLPRILDRDPEARAVCLVQPHHAGLARRRVAELCTGDPDLDGRITLVEGDIADPGLGLDDAGALREEVTEVHHLAAIYDLGVSGEAARRVNVDGTRHVLDFARGAPELRRFHHVSTCYVSGRHPGTFTEDDLDVGQTFNNRYEETKFLSEVAVHEAMADGLPATVYRPAIVVGDSRTGETRKYDGPYFFIRLLLRQPPVALLPVVGDPDATRVNVVPRDYVVDAIARLGALEASRGRVYQLADPDPLTVREMLREVARATGRTVIPIRLPRRLAKWALRSVPGVHRLIRIPPEAVDYFVHPTVYTNRNARQDLEDTGIEVPPFPSYVDRLVDFVRAHPEIGAEAMV